MFIAEAHRWMVLIFSHNHVVKVIATATGQLAVRKGITAENGRKDSLVSKGTSEFLVWGI